MVRPSSCSTCSSRRASPLVDYGVFFVYMSHFFVSLAIAAILWRFAHDEFQRFAFLFVTLSFLAFATYALFPAAPPWLASETTHGLGPTAKIIDEMWAHVGLRSGGERLLGDEPPSESGRGDTVVAFRVSDAAAAVLLEVGRELALAPALYPLTMGFTLVYPAEHYVFDILFGWLYAVVVYFVGSWAFERYHVWRSERMLISAEPAPVTVRGLVRGGARVSSHGRPADPRCRARSCRPSRLAMSSGVSPLASTSTAPVRYTPVSLAPVSVA